MVGKKFWLYSRYRYSGAQRRLVMLAGAIMILVLSGCASAPFDGMGSGKLLQTWVEITGGPLQTSKGLSTDYIVLRRPTAISASSNDLYLVDEGLRRIFRYEKARQTMMLFADNLPVEPQTSVYAAADHSVYIALPASGKVMHFTHEGISLPSLTSGDSLAMPIYVTEDKRSGKILVYDGLYNHIVVFSSLGSELTIIKLPQVQSVAGIAAGPEGIYILDRLAKKISVFGVNGILRYSFTVASLAEPVGIAVSHSLVFVGDGFNNEIRAYRLQDNGIAPIEAIELAGAVDGLSSIGSLTADAETLFVSDSLDARIRTFLIDSASLVRK